VQWRELIIAHVNKKGDKSKAYHFFNYIQNLIQHPTKLMPYAEVGDNSVDFDVTGQLLII
jgi:hypothetical protein